MRKIIFRGIKGGLGAFILFGIFMFATQDFHVFPGIIDPVLGVTHELLRKKAFSEGAEENFIKTADGETINLWHLAAKADGERWSAILLHGNGGDVANFFVFQKWLSAQGIGSYSFDYRGYGKSSGWPSERGIYEDADAVWNYVKERENPARTILFGISIGTGPALYLASKENPPVVLLVTPYTSIADIIDYSPLLRFFKPFLLYSFPGGEYIRKVNSCVIIVHARDDTVIPFELSERLMRQYRGEREIVSIFAKTGGHNHVFWENAPQVSSALDKCVNLP